jgi:polyphosphate kinase
VGRYLEHSRAFVFHHSGAQLIFLGSADWMYRNLHHRVEVVFPILDENIKKEVMDYLDIQFTPAVKTQWLNEDLKTQPWPQKPELYCVQEGFYNFLKKKKENPVIY